MRTIEIATSQNVTIRFELASTGQRILAFIVDVAVIYLYLILAFQATMAFRVDDELVLFSFSIPIFFYSLISEYLLNGRSIGKMTVGIKVMKLDGTESELIDYFGRWSTRLLDIYFSGGAIALILVSTSGNAQRLGDILSGTVVVKTRTVSRFNLADILNLQNADNYDPVYPEIRRLSEDDMVLVKQLVDRYEETPNAANEILVRRTANHLIKRLNISTSQKPDEQFLRALIKDYVILSR